MNECLQRISPSNPFYQQVVDSITAMLNIPPIEVFESATSNACATRGIRWDGMDVPVISYNAEFMNSLWRYGEAAVVGVLAHEIGHHYNLDLYGDDGLLLFRTSLNHRKELNADYFAGFMLRHLGYPREDAYQLAVVFDKHSSFTHPDETRRIEALRQGWHQRNMNYPLSRNVERPWVTNTDVRAVAGVVLMTLVVAGIISVIARRA